MNNNVPGLDFCLPFEVEATGNSSAVIETVGLNACFARTATALMKSGE